MKKNSYTLLLVPHSGSRFSKWRLSGSFMKAIAAFMGTVLFAMLFLAAHYFTFYTELAELRELRLSNIELRRQNSDYEISVENLNDQVSSLEDFVMKLSVMAGLGDSNLESDEVLVADPADVDFVDREGAYGLVKQEIDRMKGELTDLAHHSRILESFYERNSLMLASTPSIWPLRGYFSSTYGYRKDPFTADRVMHYGIDISSPVGRPIVASADGVVLYAARRGTYGNIVVIDHKFDMMTRYAHLSKFAVRAGSRVKRGEVIGYVGNTGRSRAPHLHYEVWVDNRPVHPLDYVLEYYRRFDPKNRLMAPVAGP